MKKNNILSLLLTLAMTLPMPMLADETDFPTNPPEAIHLSKTVTQSEDVDREYTITLESFVTGETVITTTTEAVPCDIVLVLDVSTSMASACGSQYVLSKMVEFTTGDNIGILHKDDHNSSSNCCYKTNYNSRLRYQIEINGTMYNLAYFENGKKSSTNSGGGNTTGSNWNKATGWYYSKNTTLTGANWQSNWTKYVPDANDIIYTDVKIDLLQKAVNEFIATVQQKATSDGVTHRIGVTTYCGSLTQYCDITAVGNDFHVHAGNNTNYTSQSMSAFVENLHLHMGGSTNHYEGFNKAVQLFNQVYEFNANADLATTLQSDAAKGRSQVVVFFTDGDPNSNQQSVVRQTIEKSYIFKNSGARVYSVGIFDDKNISNTNIKLSQFLDYTSSDYPNATTYGTYGQHIPAGSNGEHSYYFKSEGADLSSIFTSIANSAATGGASYNLSEKSVVVLDVMSSFFRLPEGTNPESLVIKKAKYKGGDYDASTSWDTPTSLKVKPAAPAEGESWDVEVTIGGKDGKEVAVTGFDFAENFVGEHQVEDTDDTEPGGYKLIIEVKIEVDPDNVGGATLYTNDARSGIYIKDKDNPDAEPTPLKAFERPTVSLPNIIIRAYGLDPGESASYTIYKIKTEIDKVTEKGDYSYKEYDDAILDDKFTPIHVIITQEAGKTNASAKVKLNDEGRYKVVEDSWAYTYGLKVGGKNYYSKDVDSHRWTVSGNDTTFLKTTWPDGGTDPVVGTTIIRTVCLGTQAKANNDPSWANNPFYGDGTLFDFIHTKSTGVPATHVGEAAKKNWQEIHETPNSGGNGGNGGNGGETPETEP